MEKQKHIPGISEIIPKLLINNINNNNLVHDQLVKPFMLNVFYQCVTHSRNKTLNMSEDCFRLVDGH